MTEFTLTRREKYLAAVAINEWIKTEMDMPESAFRRDSDCETLQAMLNSAFAENMKIINIDPSKIQPGSADQNDTQD